MYTYMHNLQGGIVAILDAAGTVVVQYKYDAWDKPLSLTGNLADTLGYRYANGVASVLGLIITKNPYVRGIVAVLNVLEIPFATLEWAIDVGELEWED